MALTHVCVWKGKSWTKITAKEAEKMFPLGVSCNSGLFMCELCGQNVTFVNTKSKVGHFKHSKGEINKDCDDRSGVNPFSSRKLEHKYCFPIKMRIVNDKVIFSIGFCGTPSINEYRDSKLIINNAYEYPMSVIKANNITYLDVGSSVADEYTISTKPYDNAKSIFGDNVIEGIDKRGTLFDKETGKKLNRDSDVRINHSYYLLTNETVAINSIRNITLRKIKCNISKARLYEIMVNEYSEYTAQFFLKLRYRLAEKPIDLFPLWPVGVERDGVFIHNGQRLKLYINGYADLKLFPWGNITKINVNDATNTKLLFLDGNERQQLLAMGRVSILKHIHLIKDNINNNVNVDASKCISFSNNMIEVCLDYDGELHVVENNIIVEKYKIKAGKMFEYNNIRKGITIKIYQGLDYLWKKQFEMDNEIVWENILDETKAEGSGEENELLHRLERARGSYIKIAHSFGAVMHEFSEDSLVRSWIIKQVEAGEIRRDAKLILQRYIVEKRERG